MDHQIAEYPHNKGTIRVYSKGLLIEGPKVEGLEAAQYYLGEDFLANIPLIEMFLGLVHEGIAIEVGGPVLGNQGQPSVYEFRLLSVSRDIFIVTSDEEDDDQALVVDTSFVELLITLGLDVLIDGTLDDEEERNGWVIRGSFPWNDIAYAISEDGFELYVEDGKNTYCFATERKDLGLWVRSLIRADEMLGNKDEVGSGQWQIFGHCEEGQERMRIERDGDRVLFSYHNPEMPDVGTSIYLDDMTIFAISLMLQEVWADESEDETVSLALRFLFESDDDNDDDD